MKDFPKVSIIITAYKEESKPYLDLLIESIYNMDYPQDKFDVTIVGKRGYMPSYVEKHSNCTTIHPDQDEFYPPVGINTGFKFASPDSKYFFMLNDDCLVTRSALKNLVDAVGDNQWVLQSISNCENGRSVVLNFPYFKESKLNEAVCLNAQQYRLEDIKGDEKALMEARSPYPIGVLLQPFLCLYAALIPKTVWEKVGHWDEALMFQDDIDYSWRCSQTGIPMGLLLNSVVFHASGVSADSTLNEEKRKQSVRLFAGKWGKLPPFVASNYLD